MCCPQTSQEDIVYGKGKFTERGTEGWETNNGGIPDFGGRVAVGCGAGTLQSQMAPIVSPISRRPSSCDQR